ncbi:hypothetical protein WMY93_014176 [Mugilogobius chulae]|uniref:Thyroglobulin type-1 domain-containing protein n=1 Tax=Mugilogobius chulae TaxID=88201 RepID=A0AAW0P4S5_9GOBI
MAGIRSLFFAKMRMQVLYLVTVLVLVESAPTDMGTHSGGADMETHSEGACRWLIQNITNPNPKQYLPQCDEDGNFRLMQCWDFVDVCWCVNLLTGEEVPGTKTHGSEDLDCEAVQEHESEHKDGEKDDDDDDDDEKDDEEKDDDDDDDDDDDEKDDDGEKDDDDDDDNEKDDDEEKDDDDKKDDDEKRMMMMMMKKR